MRIADEGLRRRHEETLAYLESIGHLVLLVGFHARLYAGNRPALHLIRLHPAFVTRSDTLTLANCTRNQELQRCINTSLIQRRIQYLRIDNGCDEENVTGLITPLPGQNPDGIRSETQLAFLRILTSYGLPLLHPLRASHGLTERQIDILTPFCTEYSIQNAGIAIGVTQQHAREMFCDIYPRLGVAGKHELIAFLRDLPREPHT